MGRLNVIDTPTAAIQPSLMPRLRHYDNLGTARFITFSCYERRGYLQDRTSVMNLRGQLLRLRKDHGVRILGYVIMPDHVHLVLLPPDGLRLGVLIGQMKGRSAYRIIRSREDISTRMDGRPAVWQRRCYDHNCRDRETVLEKIQYCHNNPVNKGLVAGPGDWPWSSYNWYQGVESVFLEIDGLES